MLGRFSAVLLVAMVLAGGARAKQVGRTTGPAREYNGHWWLLLTSEEQDGYLNGDSDCYRFELNMKFANARTFVETRESVTDFYQNNPDKRSLPVYDVIRIVDREPLSRKPVAGGEIWNGRHGYWDGQWWREGIPADRIGFVEGYLACYRAGAKNAHGSFAKSAAQYVGLINRWYGLNEESGDIDSEKEETKIADVLFKFQSKSGVAK
ncbi:MAG TPA: hypothetical protein VJO53_10785 [Candidatus Acidoferrales bacterium]|nr:hypothetical protein [Candidatus Acidoferrales bacterium]